MHNRLGRTEEFLIYGPGQQRRAVIEALRLMDNDQHGVQETVVSKHEEPHGINIANSFKEKSKKWLKFVTQVNIFYMLLSMFNIVIMLDIAF